MQLREFRALRKNSLRGFATVRLPNGLIIKDISLLTSSGRSWASLPAKPQMANDGSRVIKDGKAQYVSLIQWETRELSDGFSDALVAIIQAEHPGALE